MYCKISAESLYLRGASNFWLPIAFVGAAHALRGCGKGPGLWYSGTWHLVFLCSSFTCKTSPICFWLLCYEALAWFVKTPAAWSPCDPREFFLWSLSLHWSLTLSTCPPKIVKSVSLISESILVPPLGSPPSREPGSLWVSEETCILVLLLAWMALLAVPLLAACTAFTLFLSRLHGFFILLWASYEKIYRIINCLSLQVYQSHGNDLSFCTCCYSSPKQTCRPSIALTSLTI